MTPTEARQAAREGFIPGTVDPSLVSKLRRELAGELHVGFYDPVASGWHCTKRGGKKLEPVVREVRFLLDRIDFNLGQLRVVARSGSAEQRKRARLMVIRLALVNLDSLLAELEESA
jgi:hypothetical protein